MKIAYLSGYKYQLAEDYSMQLPILGLSVNTNYIDLDEQGLLTIKEGYAWDGPSGPAIDTKNFMRAAMVHDALYQLMRKFHLSIRHRKDADQIMRKICLEDGMSKIRAWWCYVGVRKGAAFAADSKNTKLIEYAP